MKLFMKFWKFILVLAAAAFVLTTASAQATIGPTTPGSDIATNPAGQARDYQVTSDATGNVDQLSIYLDGSNTASRVELGLYTGHRALLGRCVISTPAADKWNRCTFTAVSVTQGTRYLLAVLEPLGSTGTIRYRSTGGVGRSYVSASTQLTQLPATWTSSGTRLDATGSIYADKAQSPPPPPPPPPSGVTLRDIDGGPSYFSRFTNASVFDSQIPAADWGEYDFSQTHTNQDAGVGLNLHLAALTTTNHGQVDWAAMKAAGIYTWPTSEAYNDPANTDPNNTVVNGWTLGDEADMTLGPGSYPWNGDWVYGSCQSPDGYHCGFTAMETRNGQTANDGRLHYTEYGKGVQFSGYPGQTLQAGWESVDDAQRFVNGTQSFGPYQQAVSAEVYWYTDADTSSFAQGGTFYNNGTADITLDQRRRAYNYYLLVDHLRALDALDGVRQPVFGFVELGYTDSHSDRQITPAEVRAAVWQAFIAGARGIIYFPFAFAGPCPTQMILRDTSGCYTGIQTTVREVNAQIKQLAPVLTAQFADGYVSMSSGIDAMAKAGPDGHYYVFAGNKDNASKTGTFTLDGITSGTATVMGENRSVPITNGSFSDGFANGEAIHIYRIDPTV